MPAAATLLLGLVLAVSWGAGAALVAALGRGDADRAATGDAALALGLPVGLLLLAFPGWLLSAAWRAPMPVVVGLGALALLSALVGAPALRAVRSARPALLMAGVFILFLYLRAGAPDIRQTEKPMDAAVLTALLTTPSLPLGDPWLSGTRFPYYHFGTLLVALPVRISGLPVEFAYNLIAALLPALAAGAAFGAARLRGGGRTLATWAALALVLAGTPDGARQLLAGSPVDLWASSRRVEHAITEWPLFTFQLGDLHPHALALPLLIALAGLAGRFVGAAGMILEAALLGALVSANPWDLPGGLLLVAAGALATRAPADALQRAGGAGLLALPFLVPFLMAPHPAVAGLRRVTQATTSAEGFLHFGAFVALPALALGAGLARLRRRDDEAFFLAALLPATGIALSIVTLRPVLGLAAAAAAAAVFLGWRSEGTLRAGFLLLAVPCLLAAIPELFAVADAYGEELQRMNTVFKCYAAAAPLFVVAAALLAPLPLATRRARWLSRGVVALALAVAAVHPASLLAGRFRERGGALDGLTFLSRGDREAVTWLRVHAAPGAVLAEAPGAAYDDHGRIGTFSGRPTILGWSAHERLWRGPAGDAEVAARLADLKTLFTSREEARVRQLLARYGVAFVAVGELEHGDFGPDAFPLRGRFRAAFDADGTSLYAVAAP